MGRKRHTPEQIISILRQIEVQLSQDKTFTVEVRSGTNVLGASLIVLLLLGLVGGIVVFGIRLSRR